MTVEEELRKALMDVMLVVDGDDGGFSARYQRCCWCRLAQAYVDGSLLNPEDRGHTEDCIAARLLGQPVSPYTKTHVLREGRWVAKSRANRRELLERIAHAPVVDRTVTFCRLDDASWGVRGPADVVKPGAEMKVRRRDGTFSAVIAGRVRHEAIGKAVVRATIDRSCDEELERFNDDDYDYDDPDLYNDERYGMFPGFNSD